MGQVNYALQQNIKDKEIPDEQRISVIEPINKNTEDIQSCTNYGETKLMSHSMEL